MATHSAVPTRRKFLFPEAFCGKYRSPVVPHPLVIVILAATGASAPFDGGLAPPLKLEARAMPEKVKLGETFELELVVTHAPSQRYELVPPGELGDFEYLGQQRSRVDGPDSSTTTVKVSLMAFALGKLLTPPLTFEVTDEARVERQAAPTASVWVVSTLPADAQTSGADLYDVREPEQVPIRSWRLLYALLGVAALGALAFLAYRWLARRRQRAALPPPPEPLHVRTGRALDELAQQDLPGQARFKEFYFRLSEILRAYLGERFTFEALERTTPELLEALGARPTPGLAFDEVSAFAQESDFARYARAEPTVAQCQAHLELVYRLVDQTTTAAVPQPPTGSPAHGAH